MHVQVFLCRFRGRGAKRDAASKKVPWAKLDRKQGNVQIRAFGAHQHSGSCRAKCVQRVQCANFADEPCAQWTADVPTKLLQFHTNTLAHMHKHTYTRARHTSRTLETWGPSPQWISRCTRGCPFARGSGRSLPCGAGGGAPHLRGTGRPSSRAKPPADASLPSIVGGEVRHVFALELLLSSKCAMGPQALGFDE